LAWCANRLGAKAKKELLQHDFLLPNGFDRSTITADNSAFANVCGIAFRRNRSWNALRSSWNALSSISESQVREATVSESTPELMPFQDSYPSVTAN
jgi:hypothetical protein